MMLKVDLHEIYNRGGEIGSGVAVDQDQAVAKRAALVEIISDKGIKARYHRVEKDQRSFGPMFVHFTWKSADRSSLQSLAWVRGRCPKGQRDLRGRHCWASSSLHNTEFMGVSGPLCTLPRAATDR